MTVFKPKLTVCTSLLLFLLCSSIQNVSAQNDRRVEWKQIFAQDQEWYASAEAMRIADNILLYQHNNGGWLKNIDMAKQLTVEQKKELRSRKADRIGTTIDNGATHTQLRYLARIVEATEKYKYLKAFNQGIDYLLEAQYVNGGWPQFYPLKQGYYAHITFNDDAMMGVMTLLRHVSIGEKPYGFVDEKRRTLAKKAIDKGLQIILASQVVVDDQLKVWCAQHDRETLLPAKARAYELPSLSGKESVEIVEYLMDIDNPSDSIKESIRAAVKWFEKSKLMGYEVVDVIDPQTKQRVDRKVVARKGAGPLWGRFNDINTDSIIFVGRDGEIKKKLEDIEIERRIGYNYIDDFAEKLLNKQYPKWEAKY